MTDVARTGRGPLEGVQIAFLSWRDTHNPEGGGAERALEEVAEGLVQRGAQVTVFSAAHAGAPPEDQIRGVRYVRNGSKLTVYPRGMQALRRGDLDFVLKGVAGERRVVRLDVELEVLLEAVGPEEGDAGGNVEVVLVLHGLLRLRLNQELALEADALRVIHGHVQERREMILLPLEVRIEQGLVTLPAVPLNVAPAAERLRHIQSLLHLRCGVGEDVGVGIRRSAAHVTRAGEQVSRAPEQLHAGGLLEVLGMGDDAVEMAVGLGEGLALRSNVAVVEAIERRADLLEELKGRIEAGQRD